MALPHDDAPAVPAKRGFFERFGLLFILIGIALGVVVGLTYGRTMWIASGGPDRKLAELREILLQKSPADRLESEAEALESQAVEVEKETAALEAAFPEATRTEPIEQRIDARRAQVDELVREAGLKRSLAQKERDEAPPEKQAQVERLHAEIDRIEALAERSEAMRKSGAASIPATLYELIDFAGDLFLQALKLLVVPLIVTSMTVGITSLGDIRNVGRIGAYSLVYYVTTTFVAVLIGLVLVLMIRPGTGTDDAFTYESARVASAKEATPLSTLLDVFRGREGEAGAGMIPSNLFLAASETNVLALIIFSIVFGGALTTLGSVGEPVIAFFRGANEAVMKMVHLVMLLAPIGIFGLVAGNVARNGGGAEFLGELSRLGWYVLSVTLGLAIHAVALSVILTLLARRNPFAYVAGVSRALLTAVTTASSNATLPVTMECTIEKNRVSERSASFVLPLGATVNMDGTALYEAVAAVFIAQSLGIELSLAALVIIVLTASLAAIGAAGIPEAGLVTLVMVLAAVGLPASGIGMILAVDWFLDRLRTTLNVYGDTVGAAVVDRLIPHSPDEAPSPTAS